MRKSLILLFFGLFTFISLSSIKSKELNASTLPNTLCAEDVIVNALYVINSYVVTYDIQGQTYQLTINYNGHIDFTNPVIPDFSFDGWSLNGTVVDLSTYLMPANDILLSAILTDIKDPVVTGVTEELQTKNPVTITFDEGTALLNGNPFTSGSSVTKPGEYTLVVTDDADNVTSISFTIESGFNWLWVIIPLLILLIGAGIYFKKDEVKQLIDKILP